MFDVFRNLLNPLLYIFLFIAIGFALRRLRLLPDNAAAVLSHLESDFIIPGMVLNSFIHHCTVASIRSFSGPILLCFGLQIVIILLSGPLSKLFVKEGYYRNLYRYQLIYVSWGFMGYALVQSLFGAETLYYFILFALPMNVGCYVYGVPLLTPHREGVSALKNLFSPSLMATLAGAVLGLAGFAEVMPKFLEDALSACANMFSPVAMLLTGFTIGGFVLKEMFTDRKAWLLCLIRMVLMPLLLLPIAYLAGANEQVLTFVLFMHAMPMGLFTVIYPPRYGMDAKPGASMVLVSYLLCSVTLPVFYALLLKVLGTG